MNDRALLFKCSLYDEHLVARFLARSQQNWSGLNYIISCIVFAPDAIGPIV